MPSAFENPRLTNGRRSDPVSRKIPVGTPTKTGWRISTSGEGSPCRLPPYRFQPHRVVARSRLGIGPLSFGATAARPMYSSTTWEPPPSAATPPVQQEQARTRWPHHTHYRAVAVDRAVQQAFDGGHLPPPTDQIRLRTPDGKMPVADAQQALGSHSPVCAPLMRTISGSPRAAAPSTNRAVDALSITPPGAATASIR